MPNGYYSLCRTHIYISYDRLIRLPTTKPNRPNKVTLNIA
jgi:hypothetical protein